MRSLFKSKVGRILAPAVLLVFLTWGSPITSKKFFRAATKKGPEMRAPRSDSPDINTLVSCPSSCNTSGIEDCICSLKEDFRETWTILQELDDDLTECCRELNEDFNETWTILQEIDSSIDECCEGLNESFRETWTMLDGKGQVICPDELNCTEDVNNAVRSITSWLKTLYAYNRGWFCDDECA